MNANHINLSLGSNRNGFSQISQRSMISLPKLTRLPPPTCSICCSRNDIQRCFNGDPSCKNCRQFFINAVISNQISDCQQLKSCEVYYKINDMCHYCWYIKCLASGRMNPDMVIKVDGQPNNNNLLNQFLSNQNLPNQQQTINLQDLINNSQNQGQNVTILPLGAQLKNCTTSNSISETNSTNIQNASQQNNNQIDNISLPCTICGGKNTVWNHSGGKQNCKPCNTFFKRTVAKILKGEYQFSKCELNGSTTCPKGLTCRNCRFLACIDNGMSIEVVAEKFIKNMGPGGMNVENAPSSSTNSSNTTTGVGSLTPNQTKNDCINNNGNISNTSTSNSLNLNGNSPLMTNLANGIPASLRLNDIDCNNSDMISDNENNILGSQHDILKNNNTPMQIAQSVVQTMNLSSLMEPKKENGNMMDDEGPVSKKSRTEQ